MNLKQKIAIATPPVLIAVMYPIFHSLAGVMNDRLAWYLGLAIYWIIWGAAFPLFIIGKEAIKTLIRPQKPDKKILLLIAIPLLGTLAARIILGGYEKESVWIALLLFSTPFGNGFFEEVLWRGVYVRLFPDNLFLRMIWPSVWFALWHYVPGSVSSGSPVGLMIGAGVMGFYLSYLTKKTNTVWWAIVFHTLGGIIMVV
ncbi:MAG: CPBP family intramembrane metalloprotease [Gammaproteobacteria bacterium]|nr:CPBP family intramembrane metalloprotease [Gammaproteobacteria bacterium]MDH5706876.1 CPBP family intramembrane metalloprotease [Candidatus Aminicenantes bacterium]